MHFSDITTIVEGFQIGHNQQIDMGCCSQVCQKRLLLSITRNVTSSHSIQTDSGL